jgi:serine/threonine-protein kinase
MIQPGQQIRDYKILSKIGEGGMGEVFLAEDVNLFRRVAIKVLAPELTRNAALIDRFRQEARLQASLIHPNIITLFSFFEEHGTFMMIQEFAEGISLKELIKTKIKLDEQSATKIIIQILEGLGFAHEMGIVHRDIKPSNIMVNSSNNIKIIDFGIAKVIGDQGLTRTAKMGTVHYMSPEQVRAQKDIDQRTDIYSLGITFFEMLTGELPFNTKTDSDYEIMEEIVHGTITDPRKLNERISEKLAAIINKMTEKEKTNRYATCYQCSMDLMHDESTIQDKSPVIWINGSKVIDNRKKETKPIYTKILQEELIPASDQNGMKKTVRKKHKIRKRIFITMLILALLSIPAYLIYDYMSKWGYFGYENHYMSWEGNNIFPIKKTILIDDGKWGFRNNSGKVIIPIELNSFWGFSEGLAEVEKNGKWGYIDKFGNVVISFDYDDSYPFSEGIAAVEKNGKWGYIDKSGTLIITFEYNYAYEFYEGLAIVIKNYEYGLIDKYNSSIVPFEYDNMFRDFSFHQFIHARLNNKYGVLYSNGTICIPVEYDEVIIQKDGISVLKDGEWGWGELYKNKLDHLYFIDKDGFRIDSLYRSHTVF